MQTEFVPGVKGQKQKRPRKSYKTIDVSKLFKGKCFDDVLEAELQRVLACWHDFGDRVEGHLAMTPKGEVPDEKLVENLTAYSQNVTRIFEARRRADNQMTKRVQALTDIELDEEIVSLLRALTRAEYGDGALGIDPTKAN